MGFVLDYSTKPPPRMHTKGPGARFIQFQRKVFLKRVDVATSARWSMKSACTHQMYRAMATRIRHDLLEKCRLNHQQHS